MCRKDSGKGDGVLGFSGGEGCKPRRPQRSGVWRRLRRGVGCRWAIRMEVVVMARQEGDVMEGEMMGKWRDSRWCDGKVWRDKKVKWHESDAIEDDMVEGDMTEDDMRPFISGLSASLRWRWIILMPFLHHFEKKKLSKKKKTYPSWSMKILKNFVPFRVRFPKNFVNLVNDPKILRFRLDLKKNEEIMGGKVFGGASDKMREINADLILRKDRFWVFLKIFIFFERRTRRKQTKRYK